MGSRRYVKVSMANARFQLRTNYIQLLVAFKQFTSFLAQSPVIDPRRLAAFLVLATQPSEEELQELPQLLQFYTFQRMEIVNIDKLSLPDLHSYCETWFTSTGLQHDTADLSLQNTLSGLERTDEERSRKRDPVPKFLREDLWEIEPSDVVEGSPKYLRVLRALRVLVSPPLVPVFVDVKVHGGMTVNDIKSCLKEVIAVAQRQIEATTGQEGWKEVSPVVFFDEVNTSTQLGIFQDIMVDRTLDGKSLSRNMFWVAASNPKRAKEDLIEEGGRLSHKHRDFYEVFELPNALKDLVVLFPAQSEHSARSYNRARLEQLLIHPQIAAQTVWDRLCGAEGSRESRPGSAKLRGHVFGLPCLNEYLELASEYILRCQHFMRRHLSFSAVSQRDIERAFSAIKFFFDRKIDRSLQENNAGDITEHFLRVSLVESIMLALALVYYLRLDTRGNGQCNNLREEVSCLS